MAKDISKMKPEDLEPGRLIDTTGVCKFCNNFVTIKAPKDATKDELNEIASRECGCRDAQQAADADTSIRVITDNINSRYGYMKESARNALIALLKPIAYGYFDKATIKVSDNVTVKIYRDKSGLNCTRTTKEDDNINEWSQA